MPFALSRAPPSSLCPGAAPVLQLDVSSLVVKYGATYGVTVGVSATTFAFDIILTQLILILVGRECHITVTK